MSTIAPTTAGRLAGPAVILGGVLCVPYGVFEMLKPWGTDTIYREDVGYEVITNIMLYRIYSLPSGLALLLTSLGLLGVFALLRLPGAGMGRVGVVITYIAVALGILSLLGVVVLFDPLFTAPRIFGTLALGAATFLAGIDAYRTGARFGWAVALLLLGLLGMFLLPMWPLVYAVELMPETGGAALMALFGIGWVVLGLALVRTTGLSGDD